MYRRRHQQKASFRDSGTDFVMTNKTHTSTEQYRVELEPSSTLKAKDADAIEMQGISHGNDHEGELIVMIKIWKFSYHQCHCIVHNIISSYMCVCLWCEAFG